MATKLWKYNKGEWTEGYVFLKLLGDGRIYAGDSDMKMIPKTYLDIVNIMKKMQDGNFSFEWEQNGRTSSKIHCQKDGEEYLVVPAFRFSQNAADLWETIIGSKGAFTAEKTQDFFEEIGVSSIKSASMSAEEIEKFGGKTDIFLTVTNNMDLFTEEVGFSIKSHAGSPATLFNAGAGSKMVYRIDGCTEEDVLKINSMQNTKEQLMYIKNNDRLGITPMGSRYIKFKDENGERITGPVFEWNLQHIDSKMGEIVSTMLLAINGYYGEMESKSMKNIVEKITEINPLKLRYAGSFYETKFKELLFAAFSGLTASVLWDGKKRVTGGYIDVDTDGNMLYFRALSDDQFTSYLYNVTHVEDPSRGSERKRLYALARLKLYAEKLSFPDKKSLKGDFGYVYENTDYGDPCYCMDINFQIRFNK